VGAFGEELEQPHACERHRVGARDAEHVEAVRPGGFDQARLEICEIGQKSRLA
jgi:hypothetical protein